MTIQQMAQSALDVQTACNLSGVISSFGIIVEAMRREHYMDTQTCNLHPVSRLFAEQIIHLTGAGCGDVESYSTAYAVCTRLASINENLPRNETPL